MNSELIPTKSCYVICLKYDDSLTLIHSRSYSVLQQATSSLVVLINGASVHGFVVSFSFHLVSLSGIFHVGGGGSSWSGGVFLRGFGLEGVGVSSAHAEPVAVEGTDPSGDEQIPEQEGLLGREGVAESWGAEVNFLLLVPGQEVSQVPGLEEHDRDNGEDASSGEPGSGAVVLISEEEDELGGRDEEGDQQDNSYKDVPPGNSVAHEAVEDLDVEAEVEDHGEETDDDHSTLDWEASEAAQVTGSVVGAVAEAAATVASVLNMLLVVLIRMV